MSVILGLVSLFIDVSFKICFSLHVLFMNFVCIFWFLVFSHCFSFLGCLMLLDYFLVFSKLQIKAESGAEEMAVGKVLATQAREPEF